MDTIYICFPQGKHKALTLSYDDGKIHDRPLVALLNRYGVKSTFNINSGLFGSDAGAGSRLREEEIINLYEGHEIAVHTSTHPTLPRSPREQIVRQILDDRTALERLTGRTIRGMAYPNSDGWNEDIKAVLPHLGVDYARVTGCTLDFLLPRDLYQWQFTATHRQDLTGLAARFAALDKKQYLYLMSVYGHSIDIEKDGAWEMFEDFLKTVSRREDTWYTTNIGYVDYMQATSRLRFSADGSFVENPSVLDCWISVNGRVLEIPGGSSIRF